MKKKIICVLLVLVLGISAFALTACNTNKILQLDFAEMSDNLIVGAEVVGRELSEKEISARKKMLDTNSGYWKVKKDDCNIAEFKLAKPTTFNTAIISEVGDSVRYFRVEAFVANEWQRIYMSEKINTQRIISFDPVTTDRVRLIIDNFKGDGCKIKSLELYNLTSNSQNFNTTVYQRLDGEKPSEILAKGSEYARTFARYYDVYNAIIVFGAVNWNENGELVFAGGEEFFAKEIAALKELVSLKTNPHKVNIIVTALADGAGGGHEGVNVLMKENHTEIATAMVDKFIKPVNEGGYGLDGLDIDWEYPITKSDWKCYDTFIKEIDEKMAEINPNAIISAALSAWALKMSSETLDRIDQIQYMAYDDFDDEGIQSTLNSAQLGLKRFVKNGAKLSKINIGIPTYGRPSDGTGYWPNWKHLDADSMYFNNVYYNMYYNDKYMERAGYCSPALAGDKTALALFSGCGGIMVFRLTTDKLMDDTNAVACGIENALIRYIPSWGK